MRRKPKPSAATAELRRRAEATRRKQGEQKSREAGERLQFETLAADLSTRFINVPADQVDAVVEDAQRRICEWLGLDLCVLWQWESDAPGVFTLTHYYRRVDGPPISRQLQATELFPWALREVQAGRCFVISSVDDAPAGAERDRETFRQFGLKNGVLWPLSTGGGAPFGAVTFHDMVTPRTWSESVLRQLALVAQIFANAILRKRSEQALRESEARLSLAADSAGVGLWSLDLASSMLWVTPKTRELLRYGTDELVTWQRFLSAIHPEDRESVERRLQEVMQTGKEGRVQFRVPQSDGGVRWLVSMGRLRQDGPSAPRRVMGVTLDVTERALAEAAMREHEVRLSAAVDVAALGFYELRAPARQAFYDSRIRSIFGLADGQGPDIREFWAEHLHPDDRERVLDLSRQVLEGPLNSVSAEYRYLHPQRGTTWLRHVARVFERDAQGRAARVLGVMQDITARKQAELEFAQQRDELAHLSRVAMLGELSGSLAHELNQPLTAILSNAQAARRFLADDNVDLNEVRDILQDIVADDQRAGEVIRRLRLLLKKGEVHHLPLDLNEVVQDILKLVRNDLLNRAVTLRTEFASDLPAVEGDRVQLQQVLLNLIVNALDAMANETSADRQLTVRTERSRDGGARVVVADRGTGLGPAVRERMFEPFFTTKPAGMGLGLNVCRTIITAHGGQLASESNPGKGATFWFELPGKRGVSSEQ